MAADEPDLEFSLRQSFLVVYDYGQGGVWAFVLAESKERLKLMFPELQVFDRPPSWMTESQLVGISAERTIEHRRSGELAAPGDHQGET